MEKFKLILKTINLKVKRVPKTIRLVFLVSFFLVILLNIISFLPSYALFSSKFPGYGNENSGMTSTVVSVDDLRKDYNYYMGLNYTYSSNGTLPSGSNQHIYSDANLVQTEVIYDSTDADNSNLIGYVSNDETQRIYRYYKVYPVNNNGTNSTSDDYIEIELIDNPFTKRPAGKAFNGWTTNYQGVTLRYDAGHYLRFAKVPVTYSSGEPEAIEITFNANWVVATSTTVSTSRNWSTAFGDLKAKGMQPLVSSVTVVDSYLPYDMGGYYAQVILTRGQSRVGYYSNRGQLYTSGTCNQNTCTYYRLIPSGEYYTEGNNYYRLRNNSMSLVDPDTLPLVPDQTHEDYNEDIGNKNVAGYYKAQHFARGATVGANFYDADGNVVTSCTATNGCDYYELMQYYDSNNNPNIAANNTTYYYLVTRDTNIIVMTNSMNTTWASGQNKPFTLTTEYNDGTTNYDSNATWTVATVSTSGGWWSTTTINGIQVNAYADTTIENIRINCSFDFYNLEDDDIEFSDVSNPTSRNGGFYGNYHNVKIGRRITRTGSNGNFIAVVGGNSSSNSNKNYKLMIEQGHYMSISNTNTPYNSTNNVPTISMDGLVEYGNDYDRVANDNTKLDVYYCASGTWGGAYSAINGKETFIELTVKSGSFGGGKIDHTTGIYVGGRYGGTHNAARQATILGGYIYNLIGGPLTATNRGSVNDTYIYQKGGTIDMITGGAGTTATYGNRIIQLTGGKINYSVFGGSNGYDGSEGDGTLRGSSLVYVGGGAEIGDTTIMASNNNTMWGAEAGSVFGNGNGKSGSQTIGSNDNSNVIIDEDALVNGNVYGGGNFSAVGVSKTSGTTTTNIWVHGGTISGSVYGGGNNNGSGSSSISSTVNIEMTGGTVSGAVYGGSNEKGTIYGSTNVNIVNGTVANVFGGGKGGYIANDNDHPGTYVTQNVRVTIGDSSINPGPTISGEVFGGSAYGTVNGATNTNTVSSYDTRVTVNKGNIGSVFGGGKGSSTYTPYVEGNVLVTINGGDITNVFGGNDAAGTPNGTVQVKLYGGDVDYTYGGGNQTGVPVTSVLLDGANCGEIYGGSNQSGNVTTSNVTLTSGSATYVYGGNNAGGVTSSANVTLNGASAGTIYGGGRLATTTQTLVTLTSGTATDVFGGGKSASITTSTTVNQNGATVNGSIFGGSDSSGTVPQSTVNINGGRATSVYGGNNAGGTTTTTYVNLNSGRATYVYGGGNQATTTTSTVTLDGTNTRSIFGGGNQAGLTTSNIILKSGTATNVFGGSNQSGTVTTSHISTAQTNKTTFNNETEIDMDITTSAVAVDPYWQDTDYTSVVTVNVTVTNNSDKTITEWSGVLKDQGSTLYSNYSNHDITEDDGIYTFNQINKYDENNPFELAPGATHSFTFTIYSNDPVANFEMDEQSIVGISSSGDAFVQNSENLIVSNLYGGNNRGGLTGTTDINLTKGYVHNVYGGGNLAPVNYANINCNGVAIGGQLYGGGNQAAVNNNTTVNFVNSSIIGSIYGGGNAGVVTGNTNVYISSSTIGDSVYAGGNGSAAVVNGNATVTIDGTTNVGRNVFGGGNAAQTGIEANNNSISTVNIAGATIGGNVYGGANTSRVYGYTRVNIGYNTIPNNSNLVQGDISIGGTVFGGGEANASGSANYDFSFISVTRGIDIYIDAATHNNFNIDGSIFGSGNASSTSGYSYITIDNYGSANDIKRNISLQRADRVIINNSCFELYGAKDRTNDYDDEEFSISRIAELKIKNGTTLYLKTGANLLEEFTSAVDINNVETLAAVDIDEENKTVTKNVDNRVYILEGKVLNIAKTQNISVPGEVHGMTFFGMYQRTREGVISTGLYNEQYDYDDVVPSTDLYMYSRGSYVLGEHYRQTHDITVDGFYSNFDLADNSGKIKVDYITPTPDDADYYMWSIGEQVSSYPMTITASKYLTLGTVDLPLVMHSGPNAVFSIVGFNYADLADGVNLVDPETIPRIASSQQAADNNMGLAIKTPSSGWMNNGETVFLSDPDHPINGTINYKRENSIMTPVLQFYLYHSKNLYTSGNMGDVVISLVVVTPVNDLESIIERVNVEIHLTRALFTTNDYEGTAAPGKHYSLFASDAINITTTGSYSNYYSLFVQQQNFYQTGCYRTLVSDYVLPEKTKITLIDLHNHADPSYYYYIVSAADYAAAQTEFQQNQEVTYDFSRFIRMGSTSPTNTYSDSANNVAYFDTTNDIAQEEFIAIVDFSESGINSNVIGKSLLIELRNSGGQTNVGVLGLQQAAMQYNLIHGDESVIDVTGTLSTNNIYPGDEVRLNVTTNYVQNTYQGVPVYDTAALESQMGIKITIFDSNNDQVTGASLLGVSYELDGVLHYPRVDGTTRIKIAERISNVLARIKLHTTKSLAPGQYTMKIESFSSPDGIYYGLVSSDYTTIPFNVLDSVYGLDVTLPEKQVIIDKDTGKNLNDNNTEVFTYKYSSMLSNPQIRISMKRRKYNTPFSTEYELVDIRDYFQNQFTTTSTPNEFLLTRYPANNTNIFLTTKSNLVSGTYRVVISLYDGNNYIGEVYQYLIIK